MAKKTKEPKDVFPKEQYGVFEGISDKLLLTYDTMEDAVNANTLAGRAVVIGVYKLEKVVTVQKEIVYKILN